MQQQTRYQQTQPTYQPQPSQTTQKSNGWVWGVVAFLAASVLGLGGWIIYDKFFNTDAPPPVVLTTVNKPEKQQGNTQKNTDTKDKKDAQKKEEPSKKKQTTVQDNPVTNDEPTQNNRNAMPSGPYRMTGAIDQYPITMNISITGSDVHGTYYYHSQGSDKRMTVIGKMSADRRIRLEEYAPGGFNTGFFEGSFDGSTFAGHFSNYEKESHLFFSLNTY